MMTDMGRKARCAGDPATAIVLAGGRGRRMRAEKARLSVPGGTLLERVVGQLAAHFDEVLVSVSPGQDVKVGKAKMKKSGPSGQGEIELKGSRPRSGARPGPELRIVEDETRGQGPMAGVLAGLKAAANDVCAVVACDIPDVDVRFLRELVAAAARAEIAVPVTPAGDFEPLFAVYTKAVIPEIERLLRTGERSLIPLFGRCRTAAVPLLDAGWLRNLNTRRDYEDYLNSLELEKGARRRASGRRQRSGRRA